jgi:hypothetical protein
MNTPIERLHTALESLGLKALQARLENLLEQASKKEPSYADFLDEPLRSSPNSLPASQAAVGASPFCEKIRAI